jgi:hypothetical protein
MKHRHRLAFSIAAALCVLVASSCRGVQIHQLEKRIDRLETRVAVLESQVAAQPAR